MSSRMSSLNCFEFINFIELWKTSVTSNDKKSKKVHSCKLTKMNPFQQQAQQVPTANASTSDSQNGK